jgi:putative peptidoglycan lipid II flippase
VDKTLASGLVVGSVGALNYANLLNGMIMTLSVTILTTIIYPRLAQANSLEDYTRFSDIVEKGFALIVMISLPFSLGAMVYSRQVVQIVYERGAFDPAATALTESAYFYYSVGLLFLALNDLLIRVYYSLRDMKLPMIFGGVSVIIDIILNLILVRYMAHNGLALSTSIAALCNTVFLLAGLKRKYPYIRIVESKGKIVKIACASILSIGISYVFYVSIILPMSHIIFMRMVQLGLAVAVAGTAYFFLLRLFKITELELLRTVFKRK